MFYFKRVGKKKRLTDPVAIIPFPNQLNQQDSSPITSNKPSIVSPSSSFAKPEAKILSVPTGQLNTSNISIKKVLNPEYNTTVGNELNTIGEKPFDFFTFDQAKMVWKKYAHDMKAKGMETFYNAMIKRDPKINDSQKFTMEVDNQVQIDYITPHVNDLIGHLRSELKNYNITVDFMLSEDKESQVKFLSGKDRFTSLAKKNPNLHSFKTIFNLDIEF